jgi:hypothetical protein
VPCGTYGSRGAWPSAAPVVGIDATAAFLEVARDSSVPVIRAYMRSTVVRPRVFDAAVCLWGSFGYFDDAGNLEQARAAAEALAPGGRYLIDTIAADTVLPGFEPRASWEVGGVDVEEVRRYDAATRRIETSWTFSRAGEREVRTTLVRLYSVGELTELLASVGFATFRASTASCNRCRGGAVAARRDDASVRGRRWNVNRLSAMPTTVMPSSTATLAAQPGRGVGRGTSERRQRGASSPGPRSARARSVCRSQRRSRRSPMAGTWAGGAADCQRTEANARRSAGASRRRRRVFDVTVSRTAARRRPRSE